MSAVTATERSKTRRGRAAWLLPNIALDADQATRLRALCTHRNETASAVVRSLIASARIPKPLRRTEPT